MEDGKGAARCRGVREESVDADEEEVMSGGVAVAVADPRRLSVRGAPGEGLRVAETMANVRTPLAMRRARGVRVRVSLLRSAAAWPV